VEGAKEKMISLVIVTCKTNKEAGKISNILLKKKLAACVKLSKVKSSYWWKGKIARSGEVLMTIIANRSKIEELMTVIKKNHSYKVPEIIEIPIEKANPDYLRWALSV
jgi:periplasmic divalent cation tolerance protein